MKEENIMETIVSLTRSLEEMYNLGMIKESVYIEALEYLSAAPEEEVEELETIPLEAATDFVLLLAEIEAASKA